MNASRSENGRAHRGKALIADIHACRVPKGGVALWWLGQHGFVVKAGRTVVYIDPFLTPLAGRQVPPLLRPEDVTNADWVLGTHDHADHIDRPAWPRIAAASPRARFVVPDLLRAGLARDLGLPAARLEGLDDGGAVARGGVRISAVAVAHEFLDRDPATGRYPYLGYVVELPGFTLFHSGDACNYEGWLTKLRRWRFDAVLLPINGRDAVRLAAGCIGNMTYQEAADLAGALRPRFTIPTHYDMFAMNPGDPGLFAGYMGVKYPDLAVRICAHGRRLLLPPCPRALAPSSRSHSHYGGGGRNGEGVERAGGRQAARGAGDG
jgi:L-ascorbate metabolism protein UlaG (beta-lactamase superfamily)